MIGLESEVMAFADMGPLKKKISFKLLLSFYIFVGGCWAREEKAGIMVSVGAAIRYFLLGLGAVKIGYKFI